MLINQIVYHHIKRVVLYNEEKFMNEMEKVITVNMYKI